MSRWLNEMIWLILGPSGVGKTCFGNWLAVERNWRHLEIDRYPEGDGIDINNLRGEWDAFYAHKNAASLGQILHKRLQQDKVDVVLTFPGNLVLSPEHIATAAQAGLRTIYLYGSAAHCITTFLNRENQTGRNLDLAHWIEHNRDPYIRMSEPAFAPYRIHVFTHLGARRAHSEVFESLLKREHGE